jgi:hypothetical protein
MTVKRYAEDIAFSAAIRESYDYTCQSCRKNYRHDKGYVHCAHVHTRKHRNTRWDSNYGAIALCAKCHWRYTDYPVEWGDFLRGYLGDSNYDESKRRAWVSRKFTKLERNDVAKHYRAELKRIEAVRAEGKTGWDGTIALVSYE